MKKRILSCIIGLALIIGLFSFPGTSKIASADIDPTMSFYACNLSFSDSVYIKYAIGSSNVNAEDITLLIFTEPQENYTYENKSAELASVGYQTIQGVKCQVFDYKDLSARQMVDDIYARAYIKINEHEYYSEVLKYSVLRYAYSKLGKVGSNPGDEKLQDLIRKMLEYGASAQNYFEYKTETPATAEYYQVKVVNGLLDDQCAYGFFLPGDKATVTAAATNEDGAAFDHWENGAGATIGTTLSLAYTVGSQNETLTAVYGTSGVSASTGLEFDSNGDGTACLLGMGTCEDTDLVIPAVTPDGDTVTEIDSSAFAGEAITSVTIPATIETIGRRAFNGCASLTDVYYLGTAEEWEAISIGTNNQPLLDATLHCAAAETFTVTFKDYDGTVLKTETVAKGGNATPPADPEREGYVFNGWSGAYANVTSDTLVTATYSLYSNEQYTITFYDYDGVTVLKTEEVNSGSNATPPADPTKSGASFLGWNGSYTDVTQDQAVRAVYSDESNVLYWETEDGSTGETITATLKIGGTVSICRYFLSLKYDPAVLQLVDYDSELSIYMASAVNPEKDESGNIVGDAIGNINLSWAASSNKTKKAGIIELQFRVLNDSRPAEIQTIVNAMMCLNGSEQVDVDCSATNAVINVK